MEKSVLHKSLLSHATIKSLLSIRHPKLGAKLGEYADQHSVLEADPRTSVLSKKEAPPQPQKRIPEGVITGEIPLEAAKAYPLRLFTGTGLEPRIAYADLNSKGEKNTLSIKLLPNGGKGAEHPQIVMYVRGMYHVEELTYNESNPFEWTTWQEYHVDAKFLQNLIDALFKAKFALEAEKQ